MTADVSPDGLINTVRVKNKFTTVKTEFQHLSSERRADTDTDDTSTDLDQADTDNEIDTKNDVTNTYAEINESKVKNGDINGGSHENSQIEVACNGVSDNQTNGDICDNNCDQVDEQNNDLNTITTPVKPELDDIVKTEADIKQEHIENGFDQHHNNDQLPDSQVFKLFENSTILTNNHNIENNYEAASTKKIKLESLNNEDCDNDGFDPIGEFHYLI